MTQLDRRLFLAASAALAAAPPAFAQQDEGGAAPGFWRQGAATPWTVQEVYACEWSGMLVVAGGLAMEPDGFRIENRVGFYDPAADRWDEGPPLPARRHHPMVLSGNDGRIYVIGGYARSEAGDWTSMTDAWRLEAGT